MADDMNIKRLLEAEKKAQEIVSGARKARNDKLKQAKEEAEREISAYRAEREEAYQKKLTEGTSNTDEVFGKLDADTEKTISSIMSSLPSKKNGVVDMLINYTLAVNL